ncbi:hypothetical protein CWO91_20125 [Bradyrhizobium genosp. SA-3]|uniref:hypothetical protein n=1 Tax=Bradyrhizobium genosp. SA-3 TaxID=508868 RepID=UPI0010288594|nr:hypothetical protein [Bradyrhizobium genosp. SA-3]RZN08929.1 hypothetical protein CWO91_20125 [Bradyrhizobium genosp. SA-3]
MTDETDKAAARGQDGQQNRLKSALRENLKRRKVQARERAAMAEPSQNDDESPNEGTVGKADG